MVAGQHNYLYTSSVCLGYSLFDFRPQLVAQADIAVKLHAGQYFMVEFIGDGAQIFLGKTDGAVAFGGELLQMCFGRLYDIFGFAGAVEHNLLRRALYIQYIAAAVLPYHTAEAQLLIKRELLDLFRPFGQLAVLGAGQQDLIQRVVAMHAVTVQASTHSGVKITQVGMSAIGVCYRQFIFGNRTCLVSGD